MCLALQTCLVYKLKDVMQYGFYSIPKPTADNVTAALRRSNSSFLEVKFGKSIRLKHVLRDEREKCGEMYVHKVWQPDLVVTYCARGYGKSLL